MWILTKDSKSTPSRLVNLDNVECVSIRIDSECQLTATVNNGDTFTLGTYDTTEEAAATLQHIADALVNGDTLLDLYEVPHADI